MKRVIGAFLCLVFCLSCAACAAEEPAAAVEVPETTQPAQTTEATQPKEDLTAPYRAMAAQRREAIRTAVTDCTEGVTGNIYYVSNQGDDSNDGLSPETAWATVERATQQRYRNGDALLFQRGGRWYASCAQGKERDPAVNFYGQYAYNITLGAYGEGPKPIICGDIPQANSPDFWELYWEDDGVKIWKATEPLYDAPVIVFNDGESHARRILPCISRDWEYIEWDATAYRKTPFLPETALREDLTFATLPELTEDLKKAIQEGKEDVCYISKGPLYLRCDQGNPGEVYAKISIPQTGSFSMLTDNSQVLDLDLRYFSTVTISVGGRKNISFHNLEISWCGGVWKTNHFWEGLQIYRPNTTGGALQITGLADISVTDCYFSQIGSKVLVLSLMCYNNDLSMTQVKGYRISGNLFENCEASFNWADYTEMSVPGGKGYMADIVFEDNMVMDSGYGWQAWKLDNGEDTGRRPGLPRVALTNDGGACNNEDFYIRNNIFCRGGLALITLRETLFNGVDEVNAHPVFSGNTYIQEADKPLAILRYAYDFEREDQDLPCTQESMTDILGDTTGTLIVLEE